MKREREEKKTATRTLGVVIIYYKHGENTRNNLSAHP